VKTDFYQGMGQKRTYPKEGVDIPLIFKTLKSVILYFEGVFASIIDFTNADIYD